MPRIVKPLTDTEIKKTKPSDKQIKKSDGQGLYLIVQPNGTKYFRFDYSFNGKRNSTSFGIYPEITLAEARTLRDKARKKLKEGISPLQKDDIVRFEFVIDKYMDIRKAQLTSSTYKDNCSLIKNNCAKLLNLDIKNITRENILKVMDTMQNRGLYDSIKRLYGYLNRIFMYAVTYNYIPHNIIADIDIKTTIKKVKTKNRPAITKTEEIKDLIKDINDYENKFKADISTIYALKLSPYVFLRPFNIRALEWTEIDFNEEYIDIPKEKMKMKEDFVFPLSKQAIKILREIEPYSKHKSKYVFPSQITNLKPISENTVNQALIRLGYKDIHCHHGFRATFSTTAYENFGNQFNSDLIESCLAHAELNKVKEAYNRNSKFKYIEQKRELVQIYSDWLDDLSFI